MNHMERMERFLVTERAARWLQQLKEGGADVQADFARWLRASPLHVREILLTSALQHALRHMKSHHRVDVEAIKRRCNDLVTAIDSPNPDFAPRDWTGSALRHLAIKIIAASYRRGWQRAAIVVVALLPVLALTVHVMREDSIVTSAGEWRTVHLEDGSTLRAGPRTEIGIAMTKRQRLLRLARGEAMVYVAKDPARPLYVETELATARAVGTAFAVQRRDAQDVSVIVQEGTVALAPGRAPDPDDPQRPLSQVLMIQAGEGVTMRTDGRPLAARPVDLNRGLAWVDEKIVLDEHSTIADVIHQLNFYNRTQIKLLDPKLGERKIRGVLLLSDPTAFARTLEQQLPVSVVKRRGTLIVVPRPTASGSALERPAEH